MKNALGCNPCPVGAKGTVADIEELLGGPIGSSFLEAIPNTLDLTKSIKVTIRDQNPAGTCVGFGTTQAMCSCARQAGLMLGDYPAALAAYIQAVAIDGLLHQTEDGANIDSCLRAIQAGGYLLESEFPYKPELRHQGFKLGVGQHGLRKAGLRSHRIDQSSKGFEERIMQLLVSRKGIVGGWLLDAPFEEWTPDITR